MNIVITGSGKGIGYETVCRLLSEKHNVIALSRNVKALEVLKKKNKRSLIVIPFDLSKDDFSVLSGKIRSAVKTVDVLINNAGAIVNKSFEKITSDDLNNLYNINVFSVFKLIQSLLPLMKSNSHIVNISSMGGFQGSVKFSGLSAYSSSKGALTVLSECLAEEFKEKKISVNCLCLGAVQTEMLSNAFPGYKAPISAGEMAEFISYFSLSGHRFFNGKVLPVSSSTP